jgi:hypothetical protein
MNEADGTGGNCTRGGVALRAAVTPFATSQGETDEPSRRGSQGRLVQEVYSDDPAVEVVLID